MELFDTHCHIHFENFGITPETILENARQASVTRMLCVGVSLEDSRRAVGLASQKDNVWAAVGWHPHDADTVLASKGSIAQLKELASADKVVAIGEIGLDYYRLNSSKDNQLKLLRQAIEATQNMGLPYIFHVRDSWEDFWPVFDSHPKLEGIIHSFSADKRQLDMALERGLYIGLNGIMTFTKDDDQLTAAKSVPLDRLVLETDAPFLAPKPYRGTTAQPMHIKTIAEFLAGLRGEAISSLAAATTANAMRILKV